MRVTGRHLIPLVLLVGTACGLFPAVAAAWQDAAATSTDTRGWYQWRGPHRTGQTDGAQWPDSLEPPVLERLWRSRITAQLLRTDHRRRPRFCDRDGQRADRAGDSTRPSPW